MALMIRRFLREAKSKVGYFVMMSPLRCQTWGARASHPNFRRGAGAWGTLLNCPKGTPGKRVAPFYRGHRKPTCPEKGVDMFLGFFNYIFLQAFQLIKIYCW